MKPKEGKMLKMLVSFSVALMSLSVGAFGAASVRAISPSAGTGVTAAQTGARSGAVTRTGSLRTGTTTTTKTLGGTRTAISTSSGATEASRLASLQVPGPKVQKPGLPVSASASALEALEGRVSQLGTDLSGVQETVSGRLDVVEADIGELQGLPHWTEDEVRGLVDDQTAELSQSVDTLGTTVSGMYTKNQVDAKFDALNIPEGLDLGNYYTSDETDSLLGAKLATTDLGTQLGMDGNKQVLKDIIGEVGYATRNELNFLCDNPTFSAERLTGQNKAHITVKCSGSDDPKAEFDVPVGSDELCKPTVTGPDVFNEAAGASNTYTIGNTCDDDTTELVIKNGSSGSTCGVTMEREKVYKDNDPTKKLLSQKLTFRSTCGDFPQIGDVIEIHEGNDGASCQAQVTTERCGRDYSQLCQDKTKTGIVITKTDCDGNFAGSEYIYDGNDAEPVCAPVVTSQANRANPDKCKDIISTPQVWNSEKQMCEEDLVNRPTTTTVCDGNDAERVCAPVVTSQANRANPDKCKDIISTPQVWNSDRQMCVENTLSAPTVTTVCDGNDAERVCAPLVTSEVNEANPDKCKDIISIPQVWSSEKNMCVEDVRSEAEPTVTTVCDGNDAERACAPLVKSQANEANPDKCKDIISVSQVWDSEKGMCVENTLSEPTTTTVCDGKDPVPACTATVELATKETAGDHRGCYPFIVTEYEWDGTQCTPKPGSGVPEYIGCDGEAGTGLNYKGTLESCSELPANGNTAGDFYVIDGYMCVYDVDNGWPAAASCPDNCIRLGANLSVDVSYSGIYTKPTKWVRGKLTLKMVVDGAPYTVYENHEDKCSEIMWNPTGAEFFNGEAATGALRKCTVQWMPDDTTNKPTNVTEYYISAAGEPGCSVMHRAEAQYVGPTDQIDGGCPGTVGSSTNYACFKTRGYLIEGYTNSCNSNTRSDYGTPTKYDECEDKYVYQVDGVTYQVSLCTKLNQSGGTYLWREKIQREPETKWVYHSTNGTEPGFIVKHKVLWINNQKTLGDEVGGRESDPCSGAQDVQAVNNRSLVVPLGDKVCTVQSSPSGYNVDYNTDYNEVNPKTSRKYAPGNTYDLVKGTSQCYTLSVRYEKPKISATGATSCGATTDNPCDSKGFTETTYSAVVGAPSACGELPTAPDPEEDKCELVRIDDRAASNDNRSTLYECKRGLAAGSGSTGAGTTYYWVRAIETPATVVVHHAPTGCSKVDGVWQNCTTYGYIAEHLGSRNGPEVSGTRERDQCGNGVIIAQNYSTRSALTKCKVREGSNYYYEDADNYGAGTEYYMNDGTTLPCIESVSEYYPPLRNGENCSANATCTTGGYTKTTLKNHCGSTDPDPIITPDSCTFESATELKEATDGRKYAGAIMKCTKPSSDPQNPTTYTIEKEEYELATQLMLSQARAEAAAEAAAEANVCSSYKVTEAADGKLSVWCIKE